MKLAATLCLVALAGCARFGTQQEDVRESNGEKTTIRTKASSWTFLAGKSDLAKFRATQTEKSQSAEVGRLAQEAGGTNLTALVEAIAAGVVKVYGCFSQLRKKISRGCSVISSSPKLDTL